MKKEEEEATTLTHTHTETERVLQSSAQRIKLESCWSYSSHTWLLGCRKPNLPFSQAARLMKVLGKQQPSRRGWEAKNRAKEDPANSLGSLASSSSFVCTMNAEFWQRSPWRSRPPALTWSMLPLLCWAFNFQHAIMKPRHFHHGKTLQQKELQVRKKFLWCVIFLNLFQ